MPDECPTCTGEQTAIPCPYCEPLSQPCPTCDTRGHLPGPWGRIDCTSCDGPGLVSIWRRDEILGAVA